MTAEADNSSRLDMQLLADGPIILYFKRHVLEETSVWFGHQNYEVVTFDCSTWESQEDFHADVSQRLRVPRYYGRNLDAFNDCLSEIGRPQKQRTVLVFLGFDTFTKHFPQVAWHVLDTIATRSYHFLLGSYKLLALVQSDDPKLSFQPLGARPVIWNPHEWLNKNRGL